MPKRAGPAKWAIVLVLGPGLLYSQTMRSPSQLTGEDIASLRKFVQARMTADQIPAIAISVVLGDKFLWEEGFGLADRENRVIASPHTPFYLASVTKAITGTAVMVLQDQGRIDLDRPINDYLGSAKVHSPLWNAAGATVRRVATHTAGLTTYNRKCPLDDRHCEISTDTAIQRYGILFWPPGDHFDYSNLGYGILGEAVAHASGSSFASFLRDKVFLPLAMNDCFLGVAKPRARPIAAQYDSSSHARTPVQISDTPGASSAHCSVHDLALFGMFALGNHLKDQKRILSPAALHNMLNPTVDDGDGERYGFGWSLQPDHHGYVGVYAQGGTNDSFAVLQMIPSERIAVAVIANTGTTAPFEIVDKILSDLLRRYREILANQKTAAAPSEKRPEPSNALVGNWTGALQTWEGNVPLTIEISSSLQVRAKSGNEAWMAAAEVSLGGPRVDCVIRGTTETPDAPQFSSDIELELYLRDGILIGAGTTKGGNQLPYWVQLNSAAAQPNDSAK